MGWTHLMRSQRLDHQQLAIHQDAERRVSSLAELAPYSLLARDGSAVAERCRGGVCVTWVVAF